MGEWKVVDRWVTGFRPPAGWDPLNSPARLFGSISIINIHSISPAGWFYGGLIGKGLVQDGHLGRLQAVSELNG